MITDELCTQVHDVLMERYGRCVDVDSIHDYIMDVNENVDHPYGPADPNDAMDIADMIRVSIENGTWGADE